MEYPDPWPLRQLVLCTPRLELRPDDDAGLLELVDVAYAGIHPPEEMPFVSWTDAPMAELGRNMLRYHWQQRSAFLESNWSINFLVRHRDRVIGSQSLRAKDFSITQEISTGSWIGIAHQGNGIGTEMRAAVLTFAFDYLGATQARSGAFEDNPASLRVSEKLGYRRDGFERLARQGRPVEHVRLLLDADHFIRPQWTLEVAGVARVRSLLGAD